MASRSVSRFRLFAGPNGSGKTTLFEHLKKEKVIYTEIYNSPDRIEKVLKLKKRFSFNSYRVKVSEDEFHRFCRNHGLRSDGVISDELIGELRIKRGVLRVNAGHLNPAFASYISSMVSAYLTEKLFESKQSFCLETVMSHSGKIQMLETARAHGYQTYLYFVYTNNVEINVDRVSDRVKKHGHAVEESKIRERYLRSFGNLKAAAEVADKVFLIDNSSIHFQVMLFVDHLEGRMDVNTQYPAWIRKYYDPTSQLTD